MEVRAGARCQSPGRASPQGSSPVWAVRACAGPRGVSTLRTVQYELSESEWDEEGINVGWLPSRGCPSPSGTESASVRRKPGVR